MSIINNLFFTKKYKKEEENFRFWIIEGKNLSKKIKIGELP